MTDHKQHWRLAGLCGLVAAVAITIAACGGGGGGDQPPPPPPSVTQMVSAVNGGTINGPGGTILTIPPGALAVDTALTIALDDAGAPALPSALTPLAMPMISLTPHGTTFGVPVTMSVPVPAGQEVAVFKTNERRDGWQALVPVRSADRVETALTSFSYTAVLPCPGPPFTNPACNCPSPSPLPRIIGEPRDSPQLVEGTGVGSGGIFFWIFRVDAIACAPSTYRWMRNGLFLPNETNQDILINPLVLADNGARYSVIVTDAAGRSVTSREALLNVTAAAPVIVNHPSDVSVTAGQPATFSAASTSTIPQTLQWKVCSAGTACPASTAVWAIAASTTTVLTIPATALADNGNRYAMCASSISAGTTCSQSALLSVQQAATQPVILTQPQPLSAASGSSASFTVGASGGSLGYQWQSGRDGINFAAEPRCTNSATCTFSNAALGDDGLLLRARVSNTAGNATSDAALLTVRLVAGVALARVGGGIQDSLGLRADGRLIDWGTRDGFFTANPVVRTSPTDVATIATGNGHSLAIRANGEVFAWGGNSNGQLGDATTNAGPIPQLVPGLAAARSVAAGIGQPNIARADNSRYSTAVTAANGLVWAWGTNISGQLGIGTTMEQRSPVAVGRISGVAGVAAGGGHVLARRSDGSVWVWGRNNSGQLGTGNMMASLQPIPIPLADIVAVAAGDDFSVALRNDGVVLTWGQPGLGKLGDGSTAIRPVPAAINLPAPVIAIATGVGHALALLLDGRVYAWGLNDAGQTGTGSVAFAVSTAQRVVAPLPNNIVAIGAGAYHSLALDANGNVWAWGLNTTRQLFDGTTQNRFTPVQVQGVNLN